MISQFRATKDRLPLLPKLKLEEGTLRNTPFEDTAVKSGSLTFTASDAEAFEIMDKTFKECFKLKLETCQWPKTQQVTVLENPNHHNPEKPSEEMLDFLTQLSINGRGYIDLRSALLNSNIPKDIAKTLINAVDNHRMSLNNPSNVIEID